LLSKNKLVLKTNLNFPCIGASGHKALFNKNIIGRSNFQFNNSNEGEIKDENSNKAEGNKRKEKLPRIPSNILTKIRSQKEKVSHKAPPDAQLKELNNSLENKFIENYFQNKTNKEVYDKLDQLVEDLVKEEDDSVSKLLADVDIEEGSIQSSARKSHLKPSKGKMTAQKKETKEMYSNLESLNINSDDKEEGFKEQVENMKNSEKSNEEMSQKKSEDIINEKEDSNNINLSEVIDNEEKSNRSIDEVENKMVENVVPETEHSRSTDQEDNHTQVKIHYDSNNNPVAVQTNTQNLYVQESKSTVIRNLTQEKTNQKVIQKEPLINLDSNKNTPQTLQLNVSNTKTTSNSSSLQSFLSSVSIYNKTSSTFSSNKFDQTIKTLYATNKGNSDCNIMKGVSLKEVSDYEDVDIFKYINKENPEYKELIDLLSNKNKDKQVRNIKNSETDNSKKAVSLLDTTSKDTKPLLSKQNTKAITRKMKDEEEIEKEADSPQSLLQDNREQSPEDSKPPATLFIKNLSSSTKYDLVNLKYGGVSDICRMILNLNKEKIFTLKVSSGPSSSDKDSNRTSPGPSKSNTKQPSKEEESSANKTYSYIARHKTMDINRKAFLDNFKIHYLYDRIQVRLFKITLLELNRKQLEKMCSKITDYIKNNVGNYEDTENNNNGVKKVTLVYNSRNTKHQSLGSISVFYNNVNLCNIVYNPPVDTVKSQLEWYNCFLCFILTEIIQNFCNEIIYFNLISVKSFDLISKLNIKSKDEFQFIIAQVINAHLAKFHQQALITESEGVVVKRRSKKKNMEFRVPTLKVFDKYKNYAGLFNHFFELGKQLEENKILIRI